MESVPINVSGIGKGLNNSELGAIANETLESIEIEEFRHIDSLECAASHNEEGDHAKHNQLVH